MYVHMGWASRCEYARRGLILYYDLFINYCVYCTICLIIVVVVILFLTYDLSLN